MLLLGFIQLVLSRTVSPSLSMMTLGGGHRQVACFLRCLLTPQMENGSLFKVISESRDIYSVSNVESHICTPNIPCLAARELTVPGCPGTELEALACKVDVLPTTLMRGSLFVIRMQFLYLAKPSEQGEYEGLRFTKLFTWTPMRLTKNPQLQPPEAHEKPTTVPPEAHEDLQLHRCDFGMRQHVPAFMMIIAVL